MKIRKISALVSALGAGLLLTTAALASKPGFYAGGELGYGALDASSGQVFPFGSDTASDGFAGRALAGYQFNRYFGLEGGYSFQESGLLDATNQKALDLEAKGILPITNRFNMFGKLGGAYVSQDSPGSGDKVRPLYGLGLGYDITPRVSGTFEWNRIVGSGSTLDSNYLLGGIAYHF